MHRQEYKRRSMGFSFGGFGTASTASSLTNNRHKDRRSLNYDIQPSQRVHVRNASLSPSAHDLLIYQSLNVSSGSLSSSVSISDQSASTDCVEEYIGDVPFAGEIKAI